MLNSVIRVARQTDVRVAMVAGALSLAISSLALVIHDSFSPLLSAAAALTAFLAASFVVIKISSRKGALEQLRDAIEPMGEGIAFYDAEERVMVWNPRYADLVDPAGVLQAGVSFQELLEGNLRAGFHAEAIGREARWLETRLGALRRLESDETHNGDRWVRAERRKTRDGGFVSVCVDVTEFRQTAEALTQARDAAEAANRAKSEFLANISHELRTPLNGVMGVAEMLARTGLNDRQKEMVDTIRNSGGVLEALVTDVIDLARLESGRVSVAKDVFNLVQAVRTAAAPYRLLTQKKQIDFTIDIAPGLASCVQGDATRLRQILGNLLSNAVKFTDRGEVRLTVDRSDPQSDMVRFSVRDTGVGFEPSVKARLFEQFQQADGSSTRRHGGTGLGLAISKQAASLLGGDLDCESVPGQGSVFVLTLELPPVSGTLDKADLAEAEDASGPIEHIKPEGGASLRVLVVDDHPTNRRVVEMILDQVGAQSVSVENGQEALEAYLNDRFDVVLMDIQMPVMDGLTATRTIRLHERESDRPATPVIILSANALPEHIAAGKAAGADRHLGKPISAAALLHVIAEVASEQPKAA